MLLLHDFIDIGLLPSLIDIAKFEVGNCKLKNIPNQSFNYMDQLYSKHPSMKCLIGKCKDYIRKTFSELDIEVKGAWFNICTDITIFNFHTHDTYLSSVFYLSNCLNQGTLFKIGNCEFQLQGVRDNSILFFEPNIMHSIPPYCGLDRISLGIDYNVISSNLETQKYIKKILLEGYQGLSY